MAWKNQQMIHAWSNVLNPVPLELVVVAMDYLLGLKENTFWPFEFTPDK